ncbi:hypothetical protein THAOC_29892 [Thalassiosira oceanica]|uniref:Uncharacterized protein n=1 Tax=Thalassiosira oceanica TaxID=159749 RepID=K0RW57_THAOC|nr:hypothetical protein THAOC_29892 [Thalassiosira oceanica]|eukprot:EJK50987.1 hypothetical protein THAOC_29892 [Thalassiosira oceanica]
MTTHRRQADDHGNEGNRGRILASQNRGRGPGEGGTPSTCAASGARRAPTAADEAPNPTYDANDDPISNDDVGLMDK